MSLFDDQEFEILDEQSNTQSTHADLENNIQTNGVSFQLTQQQNTVSDSSQAESQENTSKQSEETLARVCVKVMSVGGGGGNALDYMIKNTLENVQYVCTNTDQQHLKTSLASHTIQLGSNLTQGRGAGAKADVGYAAAMESYDEIKNTLQDTDLLFLTAGLGGGTGTGATPVIAQIAQELNILTVAVVTTPFEFEGKKRMDAADMAIQDLQDLVDSIILVPNEALLASLPKDISMVNAFGESNKVLHNAVYSIVGLLFESGFINVDYADVQTVMSQRGFAIMGYGQASGADRAEKATQMAVTNPLIKGFDVSGAKGLLANVSAASSIGMDEFKLIGEKIRHFVCSDAHVIIGLTYDESLNDDIKVSIVATGYENALSSKEEPISSNEDTQHTSDCIDFTIEVDALGAQQRETSQLQRKRFVNKRHDEVFSEASEIDQEKPAYLRKQVD